MLTWPMIGGLFNTEVHQCDNMAYLELTKVHIHLNVMRTAFTLDYWIVSAPPTAST